MISAQRFIVQWIDEHDQVDLAEMMVAYAGQFCREPEGARAQVLAQLQIEVQHWRDEALNNYGDPYYARILIRLEELK